MFNDNRLKLITVETFATCIACFENTLNRVSCCGAGICEECYYEWLKTKRQCMHCKADQCDFDTWVNEYRVEPEFDPQDYLHDLLQEDNVVFGTNPMFTHVGGFGFHDLLNVIHQNLQEAAGSSPENILMPPSDLPPPDVPFEFQFGFTVTPTDLQGNPTGAGVTITQGMDYPGPEDNHYNQIQEYMQQYQQLFDQQQGHIPVHSIYDEDSPPNLEWPWNSGLPNCNQQ